jgi:hypothetical protein
MCGRTGRCALGRYVLRRLDALGPVFGLFLGFGFGFSKVFAGSVR